MAAKNVRLEARETMQRHGYDPMEALILHAMNDSTAPIEKTRVAEVLLPYMYPKLSNMTVEAEVSTTDNGRAQSTLMEKILSDPLLADAAQKLSLAAADSYVNRVDFEEFGGSTRVN